MQKMKNKSSTTIKSERFIYFDILKIIATLAVIVIHVSAQHWRDTDIKSFEWNVFNFYDSISRWSVPVFVMISGALFLNGEHSVEKIYKKNILRIVTAFVFWSFLYALIGFITGDSLRSTVAAFISGHYHMWFLFMIVGLYMITPFLRKIIENDFLMKYFLILSLIFSFIIPQFISVLSLFSQEAGDFLQGVINNIHFNFVVGFSGYFILGYFLNKTPIKKNSRLVIYILGIVGFISTVLLTVLAANYSQKPNGIFYGNLTVNVLLESAAVFVFFKSIFGNLKLNDKAKNLIVKLSKYSFGVYLVHVMVLVALNKVFHINTLSFNPIFSVPIITVLIFIVSYIISAIINNIPILKKYVV